MIASLVIPIADEPFNTWLPFALRSFHERAPWLSPVLVGREFLVAPYLEEYPDGRVLDYPHQDPFDRLANTAAMLRAACLDPAVSDPFVWSYDDVFARVPVSLELLEIEAGAALGKLGDSERRSTFGRARHEAKLLLRDELYRQTWNYERHVPLVVYKGTMLPVLEFAHPGARLAPRSVYQNVRMNDPFTVTGDVKCWGPKDLARVLEEDWPLFSVADRLDVEKVAATIGL